MHVVVFVRAPDVEGEPDRSVEEVRRRLADREVVHSTLMTQKYTVTSGTLFSI